MSSSNQSLLDRRKFLKGSAAAGALVATGAGRALAVGGGTPYTCGIALFGGDVPPIDASGLHSGSHTYTNGFRVPAGSTLTFDPNVSTTITVSGNVVIEGTLRMKPANANVTHTLRFTNVDESAYIGGGVVPLSTDVGLWVMEAGRLDLVGTEKVAWNRSGWDPSWSNSDEVRIAPTAHGDFGAGGFASFSQGQNVPIIDLGHPLPASLTFVDTFDSPHRDNIEALAASGITQGCDDGRFCPRDLVTRGQMAAFLNRALNLPAAPSYGFVDTVGSTFEDDIDRLAAAGITLGCTATEFCPNDLVTRAQMAAFLDRALGLPNAPSFGFTDTVGHRFEREIDRLAAAGVTLGCDDGLYCPEEFVTREQMASFLARAFDLPVPEIEATTEIGAEVMNLTRNVKIEGTASGKAHIFIRSSTVSTIEYVEIRHMGPRPNSSGVLGRYGLHFHANYDDTRGTVVKGTVIADTGFHAFVPHLSNGITFQDCISYDTWDAPYWWDLPIGQSGGPADESHDTLYANCVAALVQVETGGHRLAGYVLNAGERNTVIGSTVVGVQNGGMGYHWPELSHGTWIFNNNVAHNNRGSGAFGWQNGSRFHEIVGLTSFRNGFAGIEHGAYINRYIFRNCLLVDNGVYGVLLHASSGNATGDPLEFLNMVIEGPNPISTTKHNLPAARHTEFANCEIISTNGQLGIMDGQLYLDLIKLIDCTSNTLNVEWDRVLSGSEVWIVDNGSTTTRLTP